MGETQSGRPAGDKVDRILDAARASIAERGAAGATIEHVAERAGVSRGTLHYYFNSKEHMIVEAIHRDGEQRGTLLAKAIEAAGSVDEVIAALLAKLDDNLQNSSFFSMLFELSCEGQHNVAVRDQLATSFNGLLERVGAALDVKRAEGVLAFKGDPVAVARVLYALAVGHALQVMNDPDGDHSPTLAIGIDAVRSLLRGEVN